MWAQEVAWRALRARTLGAMYAAAASGRRGLHCFVEQQVGDREEPFFGKQGCGRRRVSGDGGVQQRKIGAFRYRDVRFLQ